MGKLKDFKNGLRAGAFDSYEAFVLDRVKRATTVVLKSKDLKSLEKEGLPNPFDGLCKGLGYFAQDVQAKVMRDDLKKWYAGMKGELLQLECCDLIKSHLEGGVFDLEVLDKKLKELKGCQMHDDLKTSLFAMVPGLFDTLKKKAFFLNPSKNSRYNKFKIQDYD